MKGLTARAVALALSRVLYGVRPFDPVVPPGVVLVIGLAAAVASMSGMAPSRSVRM